jgi:hypothetical protein
LAISWIHSKTDDDDDDDDAVGEEEKKLKMNRFCIKLFLLLAWVFLGVCMVTMQSGIIISLMLRSTQRQR